MATTGKIKAKNAGIYVSQDSGTTYDLVALTQSGSYSNEASLTDVTTDGSGNDAEFLPDLNTRTLEVSGLVQYEAITDQTLAGTLDDLCDAQTLIKVRYTTAVTGDRRKTCDAYISSYSEDKSRGDILSFSASIQLTGTPTTDVVS